MWKLVSLQVAFTVLTCSFGMSIPIPTNHTSEVSFILYAANLNGCEFNSICDSSVTVICQSIHSDWMLCNQTSIVRGDNNPKFPGIFTFEHNPGTRQRWNFDLREYSIVLSKRIATFTVSVDEFVASKRKHLQLVIPNGRGSLWIHRVENAASN